MTNNSSNSPGLRGTTILCLKKGKDVVIAADGQVSLGNSIMKATAKKLRTLSNNKIVAGCAGSTADALSLFERLEAKLDKHSNQLVRSAVELAKDWRSDKYLRKLEGVCDVLPLVSHLTNFMAHRTNFCIIKIALRHSALENSGLPILTF